MDTIDVLKLRRVSVRWTNMIEDFVTSLDVQRFHHRFNNFALRGKLSVYCCKTDLSFLRTLSMHELDFAALETLWGAFASFLSLPSFSYQFVELEGTQFSQTVSFPLIWTSVSSHWPSDAEFMTDLNLACSTSVTSPSCRLLECQCMMQVIWKLINLLNRPESQVGDLRLVNEFSRFLSSEETPNWSPLQSHKVRLELCHGSEREASLSAYKSPNSESPSVLLSVSDLHLTSCFFFKTFRKFGNYSTDQFSPQLATPWSPELHWPKEDHSQSNTFAVTVLCLHSLMVTSSASPLETLFITVTGKTNVDGFSITVRFAFDSDTSWEGPSLFESNFAWK